MRVAISANPESSNVTGVQFEKETECSVHLRTVAIAKANGFALGTRPACCEQHCNTHRTQIGFDIHLKFLPSRKPDSSTTAINKTRDTAAQALSLSAQPPAPASAHDIPNSCGDLQRGVNTASGVRFVSTGALGYLPQPLQCS